MKRLPKGPKQKRGTPRTRKSGVRYPTKRREERQKSAESEDQCHMGALVLVMSMNQNIYLQTMAIRCNLIQRHEKKD